MWEAALSAALGVGGSLLAGKQGSDATEEALKLQKEMFQQGREDLAPWRKYGQQALEKLWGYIEDPSKVTEMPGYEFALGEGSKALLRARSATGNLQSGATGKALTRYGQDYATTNWLKYLQPYESLSTTGENAAARTGAMGAQYANAASQNILAGGAARAGMIGNVTNALTSGVKDYYYMNQMNKLTDTLGSLGAKKVDYSGITNPVFRNHLQQ